MRNNCIYFRGYIKAFIKLILFFSAIPCWWIVLGICTDCFCIRTDFLLEVRSNQFGQFYIQSLKSATCSLLEVNNKGPKTNTRMQIFKRVHSANNEKQQACFFATNFMFKIWVGFDLTQKPASSQIFSIILNVEKVISSTKLY